MEEENSDSQSLSLSGGCHETRNVLRVTSCVDLSTEVFRVYYGRREEEYQADRLWHGLTYWTR